MSRFKIIDLPLMTYMIDSRKKQTGVADRISGFNWIVCKQQKDEDGGRIVEKTLYFKGESQIKCSFQEGGMAEDIHSLATNEGGLFEMFADGITFEDFMIKMKRNVEETVIRHGACTGRARSPA